MPEVCTFFSTNGYPPCLYCLSLPDCCLVISLSLAFYPNSVEIALVGVEKRHGGLGVANCFQKTYPSFMETLVMAIVALGSLGLIWLGFARMVSSKDEWKKEKSNNFQMVGVGLGFVVLAFLVFTLIG
jgi:hypothetical protein